MASRRCSACGVNFPLTVRKCRYCNEPTWLNNGVEGETADPDPEELDGAAPEQDSMNGGLWSAPSIEPPPAMQQTRISHFNGQCWISDWALNDAGYGGLLREGAVIRFYPTQGNLEEHAIWFELAGRAKHKRLGNMAGWWIQRMPSPEEMFADLPVTEGTDDDGRPA